MKTAKTLWILFCRTPNHGDTLFALYARNLDDAERQAREILAKYPYERLDLKAFPGGFVIHHVRIAGTMKEDEL